MIFANMSDLILMQLIEISINESFNVRFNFAFFIFLFLFQFRCFRQRFNFQILHYKQQQ